MKTTESIRWRGGQVTRIEALTDAVFGFALTLLVVSLEVPGDFDQLLVALRGFVAFACTFALLILVWFYHYRLFSRFDLEDGYTVLLNSVLLFVVLFYVYPLKFVFSLLFSPEGVASGMTWREVPLMMTIYGLGFIAVFVVFGLLYRHAYNLRDRLELTPLEVLSARSHVMDCSIMAGVGLISVILAQTVPGEWAGPASGFSYFLIGPAQYVNGSRFARLKKRLESDGNVVGVVEPG